MVHEFVIIDDAKVCLLSHESMLERHKILPTLPLPLINISVKNLEHHKVFDKSTNSSQNHQPSSDQHLQ